MRIISESSYRGIRITCFVNNEKYSIKFEKSQCEIHYKFRHGEIANATTLQELVEESFLDRINDELDKQIDHKKQFLLARSNKSNDFLPDII